MFHSHFKNYRNLDITRCIVFEIFKQYLEEKCNSEFYKVNTQWLFANKLALYVEKTNYVLFHPSQKKYLIILSCSFLIMCSSRNYPYQ